MSLCMFHVFDCEHCERANTVRGSSLVKEKPVRTLFTSTANKKKGYCEHAKKETSLFTLCSHSVRYITSLQKLLNKGCSHCAHSFLSLSLCTNHTLSHEPKNQGPLRLRVLADRENQD